MFVKFWVKFDLEFDLKFEISDGKNPVNFFGEGFYLPGRHEKFRGEFRGKFRSKFRRKFRKLRFKFRDFFSETSFNRRAVLRYYLFLAGFPVKGEKNNEK